ncbi:MAG: hypothetical protein J0M02_18210 [Planctomycetes bacterium]|nr:hypothetical protein [Planctomycetota bacterium]
MIVNRIPLAASILLLAACGAPVAEQRPAVPAPAPAAGAISQEATAWQSVGWGGGAFYYGAAWHPTDTDTLYMSGDCAGAYVSGNKGVTWSLANAGICDYAALSLVVGPAAPDHVYVMTARGVCKSTDRMKTWQVLPETEPGRLNIACTKAGSVRPIALDPRDPAVVYAGSLTGRLYKSVDGGATWSELPYRGEVAPLPPGKKNEDVLSSVAVAPTEPSLVFAASTKSGLFRSEDAGRTWTALEAPKKVLHVVVSATDPDDVWAACGEDGIRHSSDRGRTWAAVAFHPTLKPAMREIALHPAKPGLIYAIGNVGWSGHLFRSADNGATWSESSRVKPGLPGNPTLPQEGALQPLSFAANITLNPHAADELFIAGNWRNVFSADGGTTLEERSTGADNTCATDIQFLDGRTYVTAMDEGLLVSDNGGAEWRQLLPLKWNKEISGHFWRVRVAKVGDAVRIVTTSSPWDSQLNRTFRSDDGGATFAMSRDGLPDYLPKENTMWGRSYVRALAAVPGNPDVLYLGMDGDAEPAKGLPGGGIFRSGDGGRTWKRCATQPGGLRMYYGLVVDPTDTKRLYYSACKSGGGIWRSDDEGATWQHVFTGEDWSFNVEVTPSGAVLAGGKNLHRSTDQGRTWTQVTPFTGDQTIVGIAVDPGDEKRMWISRTTWDSSSRGGIYATSDGGATWREITGDIPFRKPQVLRYNPATRELWAGWVGLYKTKQ